MELTFFKYQGTGNDFIMVDDRQLEFPSENNALVARLCHRRFGIGADGLILLQNSNESDFKMIYFNSDGNLSSMCGNGGRCITRFAQQLNIIKDKCTFMAVDGLHEAFIDNEKVHLKMTDVPIIEKGENYFILNTGSPHYVTWQDHLKATDIVAKAHAIRYNERFEKEGINVNFLEEESNFLNVRTYERGVEDETYSCGTGVTASALANYLHHGSEKANEITSSIKTPGGNLEVQFDFDGTSFMNIYLIGPAERVFDGRISI